MSAPRLTTTATARGLGAFIDASPSPFHVCATVAAELEEAGFRRLFEEREWSLDDTRRFYVIRGGSIIAWDLGDGNAFRIVGGHTDSPNLRLKQRPDRVSAGIRTIALEPYGGAWLNSWLDRDLGLSGRLAYRSGNAVEHVLVHVTEPVVRVPQLAIHLSADRKGVTLDPQRHLDGVWGIGADVPDVLDWVAEYAGIAPNSVLGWELMTHDVAPSRLIGTDESLLSAPRLDNQGTCYAGLRALLDGSPAIATRVLALFDHEEVGSGSERGAASDFLSTVLERIVLSRGGSRADYLQAMASSICVSGDMAHATHPNYPERHEPTHQIAIDGGPVLKVNQNLRYASDAIGEAVFALACDTAGVPMQRYIHRADLPCGSTIGPITATRTGLTTIDVGAPQLAMHSARELMGAADVPMYSAALQAFLSTEA
ncbi:putative M18 family aminopeptidase [Gordonia polyisoprenivorans NBRC 16320 = JCM 10675]|uniref:M18 family aminopeptidase n=1 Tax=Gordonia polyisoprenivorans TaxID=84595 RepID=A0A846WIP3_9ACTN|nr:M18 family aminopeptidase [Gordonia polyisoprenivorans]NKY01595.1 M18 family aminopeptidase [Gordonia polyisoprenivorans]GAB23090.1 putative M18 family aminopeptidase [Gordonia polyisoprenivorans NBRC 16320 = JCM 10675]